MRCWPVIFAAAVLCAPIRDASALSSVEKEGIRFYFPEHETELVARFTAPLPEMLAFLAEKGLQIEPPLHVVLDDWRDLPSIRVHMTPHKEIRLPIRAPGVLEDGYTEADPWAYFMFNGLCLQGIFSMRSGIPRVAYAVFGESIAPNRVLPPWLDDGICNLLYDLYRGRESSRPLARTVFESAPVPDVDVISHHPEIWPGYHAYRIYGRPFIAWLHRQYGWEKILEFLRVHGGGVVPWEIDLKAIGVFGKSGAALWRDFQAAHPRAGDAAQGLFVTGYWSEPFVYWNDAGVFPGTLRIGERGRYGYVDDSGTLWLSEYAGTSRIFSYSNGFESSLKWYALWDPGPGRVVVGRRGHRSALLVFPDDGNGGLARADEADIESVREIPAPPGVIQLSGPVRNAAGHIAVAANRGGNWDIWVHADGWHRITDSPSIELDPWWEGDTLVWASNATGRFQIHQADHRPITSAAHAALLPRGGSYLELAANGWLLRDYAAQDAWFPPLAYLPDEGEAAPPPAPPIAPRPYNPFASLLPNYIEPDVFAGILDFQLGLSTGGRDVTGDYRLDAGLRYSFDSDILALQALLQRKTLGTNYARYPFGYDTALGQEVSETRNDVALFWTPLYGERIEGPEILRATTGADLFVDNFNLSLNWRAYGPQSGDGPTDYEGWIGITGGKSFDALGLWGNVELFTENRQSVSAGIGYWFGDQVVTSLQLMGGTSWGNATIGHTTFRIGGGLTEGAFTRRATRLFPVRGFDANVIEAPTAAAATAEVFWPLANLQLGYRTLPLFLHRLRLGTFVDAGYARVDGRPDDFLLGAGLELLTSLELGWGGFSTFRIGVAWPLAQPSDLDQEGPLVVFQLGRPL